MASSRAWTAAVWLERLMSTLPRNWAEAEPKMLEETDELVWRPSYQLTAFGINVGGERLNFFSELGYGCAGVFNMGFRISL